MTPGATFRLHVLGPVTVRRESDPVLSSRVSQPLQLGLLCYLALARPRGLHSRDTIIALFWPDHDAPHGRHALRNALHGLRLRLGDAAIVSTGDQLVGLDPTTVACDAIELERGTIPRGLEPRDVEPMQGFFVSGSAAFDHWLSAERDRLRALLARFPGDATAAAPALVAGRPTYSPDAWVMHARGHYLFLRAAHGGMPDDLLRCRDCFERALAFDPTFAPALAGLANFYAVAARRGVLAPFHSTFARAITLSEQAAAMDSTLPVPHVHFAVKAMYLDDDWDRAGVEFALAVRKDPSYAEGHRFYGVWLGLSGRHVDALREMEQAVALEPDIPHFLSSLGAARLATGDRAGAEEALRRTLLLDPRHAAARERLVWMLEDDGRLEAAVEERERPPALPDAAAHRAALDAGEGAYRRLTLEALQREASALEERVMAGGAPSVNDIFSPPVVRLVTLLLRAGQGKRARSWQLQAKARRPGLARWFPSLPEPGARRPRDR